MPEREGGREDESLGRAAHKLDKEASEGRKERGRTIPLGGRFGGGDGEGVEFELAVVVGECGGDPVHKSLGRTKKSAMRPDTRAPLVSRKNKGESVLPTGRE